MFSDELITLMAIEKIIMLDEKQTGHPENIVNNEINDLCDSLVKHGYVKGNSPGEFRLTSEGWKVIQWETIPMVACSNDARTKDRIESLRRKRDEISQQVAEFVGRQQSYAFAEDKISIL